MARPKKEEVVIAHTFAPFIAITPLTVDFGRADLNELRNKLNEVISRL